MQRYRNQVALEHFSAMGFDLTEKSRSGGYRIACSQCEALVLNGHATHELGCPNATQECAGCNAHIPASRFHRYCEDCQ